MVWTVWAAGVAVIASGYISYAAVLSGQYGVALAMIAVTGGALGFLPFNFHPGEDLYGRQRIPLSGIHDCGHIRAGFDEGGYAHRHHRAISGPGACRFSPVGLSMIIRRWMNGTPIMEADKGHVHHRIMNTGIGQRRTVLIMYCISAVMGMVAIMVVKREFLVGGRPDRGGGCTALRLCGGSFQPQSDYARRGIYCGGKERRIRKKRGFRGQNARMQRKSGESL